MAISPLLSIGSRAMAANQAVLSTISNNIANASTPGYSRQQTILSTAGSQNSGNGFYGQGVDVETVTRNHNEFLTTEAQRSSSLAAADQSRASQLSQLENVFPTGEQGVGFAANALMNSFVDVANTPQDSSARQVVLAKADELVNRFNNAGEQLGALQNGVAQDIQTGVTAVNSLAKQLAAINKQIGLTSGSGHTPNDLLDKRDLLVKEIGTHIQVSTLAAENGQMNLFIAGGQQLVLGSNATTVKVLADPYDSNKVQLAVGSGGGANPDVTIPSDSIAGGSLAGLLRFQNHDMTDAKNLLGQMASAISGAVNKQQSLGMDLKNPPGKGAPVFSVAQPEVLPAATNGRTGNAFTASVNVTVADSSQLLASDYTLQADPSATGKYLLTRGIDGVQRSISSGDQVDGMTITVPTPLPAANDKFLLRPVGNAASTLAKVLDDPLGIAAASPVQAMLAPTNTGTASVESLRAVDSSVDPGKKVAISFSSDTGAYNWTTTDASTGTVTGSGTGTWTAGEPIELNGFELQLSGVPRAGDAFTVGRTQSTASNNSNALAMVALRDQSFIGNDSSASGGATITNAYSTALADVGVRVQTAKSTAATSASVAADAEASRSSDAGVNLDEEAAKLIQFQQSYQAAAKVLSVAQAIFDTLLQATQT